MQVEMTHGVVFVISFTPLAIVWLKGLCKVGVWSPHSCQDAETRRQSLEIKRPTCNLSCDNGDASTKLLGGDETTSHIYIYIYIYRERERERETERERERDHSSQTY
jgi:hypothetical protein